MKSVDLPTTLPAVRRSSAAISAPHVFLMILEMAECIRRLDEDGAYRSFVELVQVSRHCSPDLAVKADLFSHALIRAIDPSVARQGNIYLRHYDCPHIDLFNLLAERFPPMIHVSNAANAVAANLMAGREEVVLLDIGIGAGRQVGTVIRTLAARRSLPRMLTVIGVDPSRRSLEQAESGLSDIAAEVESGLRFIAIQAAAEDLTADDWARIRQVSGDLFATATFSLHHIGRDAAGAS